MTHSQALEAVSEFYVPGVVNYYAQLNPDPWQKIHDDLEKVSLLDGDDIVSAACERFVARARELVDRFKRDGQSAATVSVPQDAYALGSDERYKSWSSLKRKHCYKCEARESLSLEPCGDDLLQVRIVCAQCKTSRVSA